MSPELQEDKSASPAIDPQKLRDISNALSLNFSPIASRTLISDSVKYEVSGSEESRLAELILKAAFDGKTHKIAIIESTQCSTIQFFDEQSKRIAQLNSHPNILIGLRNLLLNFSWTIDEDEESSAPIHYFKFSEKEQGGIAVLEPRVYLDGTIVTIIDVFHINNKNFFSRAILES